MADIVRRSVDHPDLWLNWRQEKSSEQGPGLAMGTHTDRDAHIAFMNQSYQRLSSYNSTKEDENCARGLRVSCTRQLLVGVGVTLCDGFAGECNF
jgi:hypothetical protein